MDHFDYIEQTKRTDADYSVVSQRFVQAIRVAEEWRVIHPEYPHPLELLHGLLGMVTETGELVDTYKKWLFYGKQMDVTNLGEELGDVEWYEARVMNYLRMSLERIWEKNIKKLQIRYPEKFDEGKALNRDLESERKELEK